MNLAIGWLVLVGSTLCVAAVGISWLGITPKPQNMWLAVLSAGTILWLIGHQLYRRSRNRYRWSTSIKRWVKTL
jgi:hypothetical protein